MSPRLRFAEFNEGLRRIAVNGRKARRKFALAGPFNAVGQLADKDMIPDQQRGNHRAGGNLESLDDKHPNRKGQEHRYDNGFCILANKRLPDRLCGYRRFVEHGRSSRGIRPSLWGRRA